MAQQLLIPGMQHAEEADLGAQVAGITGDLKQGLGRGIAARAQLFSRARRLFFEPVQLYLQPADLLIKRTSVRLGAGSLTGPAIHEKIGPLLDRRLPPLRDLHRVDLELRSQLAERLLAADRLYYHPRLELRTVLFPRRRHQPLRINDSAAILAYCLV
jgi:hypothetical protein